MQKHILLLFFKRSVTLMNASNSKLQNEKTMILNKFHRNTYSEAATAKVQGLANNDRKCQLKVEV